jgi:hypothetical protein
MTHRLVKRRRPPDNTLQRLEKMRESMYETYASIGMPNVLPWLMSSQGTRHFLVFPKLPASIPNKTQREICKRWARVEIAEAGADCNVSLSPSGAIFSFAAPEITDNRSFMREWGDEDNLLSAARTSFTAAVNSELSRLGLPADFK